MRALMILLSAVVLAGCGATGNTSGRTTAPQRPATAAAVVDTTREACHSLSAANPDDDVDARFDPATWQQVAQAAKTAKDPGISTAGARLLDVVRANEQLPEQERAGRPNLDLDEAVLGLADACGSRFGDGPW